MLQSLKCLRFARAKAECCPAHSFVRSFQSENSSDSLRSGSGSPQAAYSWMNTNGMEQKRCPRTTTTVSFTVLILALEIVLSRDEIMVMLCEWKHHLQVHLRFRVFCSPSDQPRVCFGSHVSIAPSVHECQSITAARAPIVFITLSLRLRRTRKARKMPSTAGSQEQEDALARRL